ncbi:MAG: hypothetical protein FWC41_13940 [Firmicutes bacterium]|nr:hypothetical protein [Bacillota bacterium]
MTCREYIENYEYIKENGDMLQYFKDLKKENPVQYEKEIKAFKEKLVNKNKCDVNEVIDPITIAASAAIGDIVRRGIQGAANKIKQIRTKRREKLKAKKDDVNEQTSQINAMSNAQRLNTQGMNHFMRKGYDYKITGQFKNAEHGAITNQEAPSKENENPNLDITTHDYVLVKLHGQKFPLKIVTIIGNEYVGTDNQGREFKFDKSQIMRKI